MRSRRSRIASSSAACALVSLALVAPAAANHTGAQGTIEILRGTNQVSISTATALCSGTFCSVDVPLGAREYRRFVRWCATDTIGVGVLAGQFSGVTQCPGGGAWRAFLTASLTAVHGSLVAVQIRAVPS